MVQIFGFPGNLEEEFQAVEFRIGLGNDGRFLLPARIPGKEQEFDEVSKECIDLSTQSVFSQARKMNVVCLPELVRLDGLL